MKLLQKKDIPNYFSGCLTLTIERDKKVKKEDYICIVDIDEQAEKYVYDNFSSQTKIVKRTHVLNKEENKKLSWEERFKNVKALLDVYQGAKLVITSRLHCALPCLALETPVLLLYDEDRIYTKDRLSYYVNLVNNLSTTEFLQSGKDKINNNIENPKQYMEIRKNIINKVQQVIDQSSKSIEENNPKLPEIEDYKKLYIEPKKNIDYLYQTAIEKMYVDSRDYTNLRYERDYWKKEWHILLEESNPERVKMYKKELNSILSKYEEICKENYILKEKLKKYKKKKEKKKHE